MPAGWNESDLVEAPAVRLFVDLGWQTVSAREEVLGAGGTLGRETKGETVLAPRLRAALEKLNPALPPEAISVAVDELARARSAMSLVAANREVYGLLKDGVKVSVPDREQGGQRIARVRVIDWENPAANDFLLVSQMSITGALYTRRPDLVGFINGLPMVVIEFKKTSVPARAAFDDNLTCYKADIPQLFWSNALMIVSNGTDSRVGSLTADWERFFEWKRVESEDEPRRVSLEAMIRGTCEPGRLLDLIENFTLFSEHKAGLVKVLGQNHQFLGVNNAIAASMQARRESHGRGGVFWQTQGSGKSFSMVFYAQKILRKVPGNWTFVIVTDRTELDDQIAQTFKTTGAVSEGEGDECHAASGAHLRELLRGNHRCVFTLIHKFRSEIPSSPALLPRGEGRKGSTNDVGGEEAVHYRGGLRFAGLVKRARELRQKQTGAEKIAWEVFRDRQCEGMKFRRQHQVGDYIADFFCAEARLIVEFDGEVHSKPEQQRKDATRDSWLRAQGFRVLRFRNEEFLSDPESVLNKVAEFATPPDQPAPRTNIPSPHGRRAGDEGRPAPIEVLSMRKDIVVLADEAHRSQYDTLAVNMRSALPNALFLAFTGTPLIAGEERTREVFGDYVSIYDFQQSVEDGATVPLFYENRTPELRLENPDLNDEIYAAIEEADLDEEGEKRLERELGRQYHLITRDDRLETVAADIVRHFLGRGFQGKAMVVCIDKATALRMHDKVQARWQAERAEVEARIAASYQVKERTPELLDEIQELNRKLAAMKSTDMALIVSTRQNEIEQMHALGLDIAPHRKRMNGEPLDEKFKDAADPLRLVFVCAMWLTGFDAPSCSTVYLDKPMRNHTLMQTIARANRVFPGKHSGLIVDYANVFASLEKALAIYGAGKGGAMPVRDKTQLVADLRKAVEEAVGFCAGHGVSIPEIEGKAAGGMERLTLLANAVDALISPDPLRKQLLAHERLVTTLYDAVKPDPAVVEFASQAACLAAIAGTIRERLGAGTPDISAVMAGINRLLDDSIAADGFHIPSNAAEESGRGIIDISRIDFEALASRFKKSNRQNLELEQLKAAIRAQLEKLIRLNKTRADYLVKFEELIDSYNAGSRNIDELFQELLTLTRALSEEQQRHVRENLTEEELTILDLLTRPGPDLSPEERDEVKKVAKLLLARLKQVLVLDWRRRNDARAKVRLAIEDVLDDGLPRAYSPDVFQQKCATLFEHIFESHGAAGREWTGEAA